MTDEKTQPNSNDRSEQVKQGQAGQQARQNQESTAVQPIQRTVPGRRPLFGT